METAYPFQEVLHCFPKHLTLVCLCGGQRILRVAIRPLHLGFLVKLRSSGLCGKPFQPMTVFR